MQLFTGIQYHGNRVSSELPANRRLVPNWYRIVYELRSIDWTLRNLKTNLSET
jgi:hypothetical protein